MPLSSRNFDADSGGGGSDFLVMYRLSMQTLCQPDRIGRGQAFGPNHRGSWRKYHQYGHWLARVTDSNHCNNGASWWIPFRHKKLGQWDSSHHDQSIQRSGHMEEALAEGCADMVSMARPFCRSASRQKLVVTPEDINTCIGCNQACLDHVFKQKTASCLVNPGVP